MTEIDDIQFAYIIDFNDSNKRSFMLPDDAWYSVGEKTFWQPKKEEDDFQGQEQDIINHNDLKNELSKLLKEPLEITYSSKKNLCQSG